MDDFAEVQAKIRSLSSASSQRQGASVEVIARASASVGVPFPPELVQWLLLCRGPVEVGSDVILGVETCDGRSCIEQVAAHSPIARHKDWIPVASDGCGNYYVLVRVGESWPVGFVDSARRWTPTT